MTSMPTKRTQPKPSVKKKAVKSVSKKPAQKKVVSQKNTAQKPSIKSRKTCSPKNKSAAHNLAQTSRKRVKVALVAAALVLLGVGIAFGVDYSQNANRAYPGVYIGDVSVGGKTEAEIEELLAERYSSNTNEVPIVVFASEEARMQASPEDAYQEALLAEQISVEEDQNSRQFWQTTTQDLGISLDTASLAQEALSIGRSCGGIATRIDAAQNGYVIEPRFNYDESAFDEFLISINAALGTQTVESDITVEGGVAYPYEGQDGYLVKKDSLKREINTSLQGTQIDSIDLVAQLEDAPFHITYEQASTVADEVTHALRNGVVFTSNGVDVSFSADEVGSWISTHADEAENGWVLQPNINVDKAHDAIIAQAHQFGYEKPSAVHFINTNTHTVSVETDNAASLPLTSEAVSSLDDALFGTQGKAFGLSDYEDSAVVVELPFEDSLTTLTLDEAIDHGLICVISRFTTAYTTGVGTENRNHNIELVSSLLNNSVIPSQASWSFNGTAGECNEAAGFLDAGAIVDGEYASEFGGGICQVATTIFNAVFESGFPVDRRYNHSLYMASYPAGRDAAVSWPDLDLIWTNDSQSEVLLTVTCDSGALTATLYGVDPGYSVTSETSEWEEGKEYSTRTELDETLAPNTSYTKTRGVDGSKISVTRSVMDEKGSLIRKDLFVSIYEPVTEVIVEGPKDQDEDSEEIDKKS